MHVADHVEDYAKELRGNWMKFESFGWSRRWEIPDPENWAIVYTDNRDSGLIDKSNASAIAAAMKPFVESEQKDIYEESHRHWAVGYVDGYAIRVHPLDEEGVPITDEYTPAFEKYCELLINLENYPILDENDYSHMEFEATIRNIMEVGHNLVKNDAPDGWAHDVYRELPDGEIENTDDRGGWPSEKAVAEALRALDMLDEYYDDLGD